MGVINEVVRYDLHDICLTLFHRQSTCQLCIHVIAQMTRNKVGVEKMSDGSEEDKLKDHEDQNSLDTVATCNKEGDLDNQNNSRTFRRKLFNFFASIFSVTSDLSLEEAEAEYKERKLKREEELKEIVEEKVYKTPWVFSIYGLLGSFLGLIVVTVGFFLWKRENVYTNPDAW